MKTKLFSLIILIALSLNINAQTVTSAANGNWTNPLTWGGTMPVPGNTIIINHNVTLDMDFGYSSGSITVNTGGSLTGNSGMRGLAVNYPSGSGSLAVNGTFNVARVSCFAGTISISGSLQSDSLYNQGAIAISNTGIVNAAQFMNSTGGIISNDGNINSTNLLNFETITNNGVIHSADFHNCKTLTNNSDGVIDLNHDFLNADSIVSPAVFTNNGQQLVMNDWQNQDTVKGSGKFCIVNNTKNSGVMKGNFDFCDLSGGNIDLNNGNIDPTITFCAFPCTQGKNEIPLEQLVEIYPNPSNGIFTIKSESVITRVEIVNLLGKLVYSKKVHANQINIDVQNEAAGIYFYKLIGENKIEGTGKIVIER